MENKVDRRGFGKSLVAGVATAGIAGAGAASVSTASAAPLNGMFAGLKVRRNDKVRLGGEYRLGGGGTTSKENIEYQQRWGIKYITSSTEGPRASPMVLPVAEAAVHAGSSGSIGLGGRMTPSEPWNLDGLKQLRDILAENGLVFEAIRMDSAYMPMKPGPDRDRYLDVICDNVRKAGEAGVKVISQHWSINPLRRNISVPGRGGSTYTGFKLEADLIIFLSSTGNAHCRSNNANAAAQS